jgi:hypothetical protein
MAGRRAGLSRLSRGDSVLVRETDGLGPVPGADLGQQVASTPSQRGRDLAVLAAWAAVGVIASFRFFRWDPTRPQHAHAPAGAAV